MRSQKRSNQEAIPAGPPSAAKPVSGKYGKPEAILIEEIAAFIRRFVFFRDDVLYDLVSAWVVMAYLKDQFEYVGYLFATLPSHRAASRAYSKFWTFLLRIRAGSWYLRLRPCCSALPNRRNSSTKWILGGTGKPVLPGTAPRAWDRSRRRKPFRAVVKVFVPQ
jgi:hypothetical protein